jgi:hypothetical protein
MSKQGAQKGTYLNEKVLHEVEEAALRKGITVSAWIKQAILEKLLRG